MNTGRRPVDLVDTDALRNIRASRGRPVDLVDTDALRNIRASGIFAKMRRVGINILKDFWAEGKKEIIKKVLNGSIDDTIRGFIDAVN